MSCRLFNTTKVVVILTVLSTSAAAFSAGLSVQPLYLEFAKKRKVKREPFSVTVSSENTMRLKLDLYKAVQERSGKLSFIKELDEPNNTIELKKYRYLLKANKRTTIPGFINYPRKTNNTYVYALMIEEDKAKTNAGINVNIRYAVILKVNTGHRKTPIKAEISRIGLSNSESRLILSSTIVNKGAKDFYIKAKAKIRDESNKLVETVDIRSASAWQRKDPSSIIFPNSEVELAGSISRITTPGTYSVAIHGRINNRKSISQTSKLEVLSSHIDVINRDDPKSSTVSILPAKLEIVAKRDVTSYMKFSILNQGRREIEVGFPTLQGGKNLSYNYLFIPSQVKVRPGSSKKILIKARRITDKVVELKEVDAIITGKNGEFIGKLNIPLTLKGE